MFGWTIRNCFPSDLEISIGSSSYFVPMNIFNSAPITDTNYFTKSQKNEKEPKTLEEIERQQRNVTGNFSNAKIDNHKNSKSNESATLELKNILGLNTKHK